MTVSHVYVDLDYTGSTSSWGLARIVVERADNGEQWQFVPSGSVYSWCSWPEVEPAKQVSGTCGGCGRVRCALAWLAPAMSMSALSLACARPQSSYRLTTYTGTVDKAPYDGDVYATLIGKDGTVSAEQKLNLYTYEMAPGASGWAYMSVYTIPHVEQVKIRLDGGSAPRWALTKLTVTNEDTGALALFESTQPIKANSATTLKRTVVMVEYEVKVSEALSSARAAGPCARLKKPAVPRPARDAPPSPSPSLAGVHDGHQGRGHQRRRVLQARGTERRDGRGAAAQRRRRLQARRHRHVHRQRAGRGRQPHRAAAPGERRSLALAPCSAAKQWSPQSLLRLPRPGLAGGAGHQGGRGAHRGPQRLGRGPRRGAQQEVGHPRHPCVQLVAQHAGSLRQHHAVVQCTGGSSHRRRRGQRQLPPSPHANAEVRPVPC